VWLSCGPLWVQRWYDTAHVCRPRSRKARRNQMLRIGRWLAAEHPEVQQPDQWTRELCAAWVAAVDRVRIGDYTQTDLAGARAHRRNP